MAIDRALLDLADREGLAVLRIYRWAPHCLSFGRNEPALRRYDREMIMRRGIPVVRRPTGGRAVWHAREVTYSLAAPAARFGTLPAAYLAIHRVLAQALSTLGVATGLAPRSDTAALDAGACFASPVGGEVVIAGRKIVGSAQLRLGNGLLQHGSVLLDDDQQLVAEVTVGVAAPGRDAPLNSLLATPVSFEVVAASIARAAELALAGRWSPAERPDRILHEADAHLPLFESDAWTWRR